MWRVGRRTDGVCRNSRQNERGGFVCSRVLLLQSRCCFVCLHALNRIQELRGMQIDDLKSNRFLWFLFLCVCVLCVCFLGICGGAACCKRQAAAHCSTEHCRLNTSCRAPPSVVGRCCYTPHPLNPREGGKVDTKQLSCAPPHMQPVVIMHPVACDVCCPSAKAPETDQGRGPV